VNYPTVIPMLAYENGPAAMNWLISAFGFTEKTRWLADDGKLSHGELLAGDGLIMLSSAPDRYQSPKALQAMYEPARKWFDVPWVINGVLVYVPDLEAHFKQAVKAGVVILSEIEDDPPGKRYRAADLEGQRWFFFEQQ
jgi:PhnB protein